MMILKVYIGKMNRCDLFLEAKFPSRKEFDMAEAELKATTSMLQKVIEKGMKAYEISH